MFISHMKPFLSEKLRFSRFTGFRFFIALIISLSFTIERPLAEPVLIGGGSAIPLYEHLEVTTPPDVLFSSTGLSTGNSEHIWYKVELQSAKFSVQEWLIQFRQVPFQQLDFFTPTPSGYQLHKLGSDSQKSASSGYTVALTLSQDNSSTFYIRYQSLSPNRLSPTLWPVSSFQQQQDNQNLILSSFQLLLLAMLCFVFFQHIRNQNSASYLMISHTLAASALLVFWQGDIFRVLPWLGDPGHWVAMSTITVLVISITSYRQLTALSTYTPLIDKLILVCCTLALAMTAYFFNQADVLPPVILETALQTLAFSYILIILGSIHCLYNGSHPARSTLITAGLTLFALTLSWSAEPWPRSLPSYPELIILSLQACVLPAIHWYQLYLSESRNMALNVVNTNDRKRQIYESALRKHLQTPGTSLKEADIPNRILLTLEDVTPAIPAFVLIFSDDEWALVGDISKPAQQLYKQLPSIQQDLLQIVADDQDTRINFKDRFGHFYWIFPLSQDPQQTMMLVMAPSRTQRIPANWQTACNISSHGRTLLQVSQQSQFWQQQACLDSLTGLLNRRAFYQEAGQQIEKSNGVNENTPCCALFIDIDHFKRVNDRFGHARGDQLLKETAKVCRQVLRHQDLLGRYGGEEFVALLPNTEPWQALQVAERIRRKVAETESLHEGGQLTLSIGLSALSSQVGTLEELLADADKAMYQAKQKGRNQTCISAYLSDARLPS